MQLAIVAAGFTPGEADSAAARDGGLEAKGRPRPVRAAPGRGHARARLRRGIRAPGVPADPRLRRVRLPGSRTPRASRCSSTSPPGSSGTSPPPSAARSSTASRWASTRRRSSCATRARTASRCCAADVNASAVESTLEAAGGGTQALRLGLDRVRGLAREAALRIVAARAEGRFGRVPELARRAGLDRRELAALAAAGALAGLAGHRHRAGWEVLGVEPALPLLPVPEREEGLPLLPVADRRRGHRRGLPRARAHAGAASARAPAPAARAGRLADGCRGRRPRRRCAPRDRRDRRHAPASGQRRRASSS